MLNRQAVKQSGVNTEIKREGNRQGIWMAEDVTANEGLVDL